MLCKLGAQRSFRISRAVQIGPEVFLSHLALLLLLEDTFKVCLHEAQNLSCSRMGADDTQNKKKKCIEGKVLNKAQVAKGMCCRFAFESAHMLCEFCKTFQQMPFKTFTQRKQTMSPRRSCYNPAFCCSASAQQSSSPLSKLPLLPQPCLLLSPLKAQTQSLGF